MNADKKWTLKQWAIYIDKTLSGVIDCPNCYPGVLCPKHESRFWNGIKNLRLKVKEEQNENKKHI